MERIKKAIEKAKEARGSENPFSQMTSADAGEKKPALSADVGAIEAAWSEVTKVQLNAKHLEKNLIITYERNDPKHTAFDILRTKLRSVMNKHDFKSLAVTSPTSDCGKSVTSANLAFSLAHQENIRTVLLDFDLKNPHMYKVLGVETGNKITDLFGSQQELQNYFIKAKPNLIIGLNKTPQKNTSELINWEKTSSLIEKIRQIYNPDIIIFDLPPVNSGDDVLSFLPAVDLSMLIVANEVSKVEEIKESVEMLKENSNYAGIILNKSLAKVRDYAYYG